MFRAFDRSAAAIAEIQSLAVALAPICFENFRLEPSRKCLSTIQHLMLSAVPHLRAMRITGAKCSKCGESGTGWNSVHPPGFNHGY
jgi:hypothetical protein